MGLLTLDGGERRNTLQEKGSPESRHLHCLWNCFPLPRYSDARPLHYDGEREKGGLRDETDGRASLPMSLLPLSVL